MRYVEFKLPVRLTAAYAALGKIEGWELVDRQFPNYVSFQNGAVNVNVKANNRDSIEVMIVNEHCQNHQLRKVLKTIRTVLSSQTLTKS